MPFPGPEQLGVMEAFEFAHLLWNFCFTQVPHGMLGNKTVTLYLPKEKDQFLELCDINSKAGDISPFLID